MRVCYIVTTEIVKPEYVDPRCTPHANEAMREDVRGLVLLRPRNNPLSAYDYVGVWSYTDQWVINLNIKEEL